jgi:hypothetical protein
LKRSEREELVELRRENRRLRLEREILKNCRMPRAVGDHLLDQKLWRWLESEIGPEAMAVRFLMTSRTR